jgi:tripartite ATP-independent transporter DctP family solute receptor
VKKASQGKINIKPYHSGQLFAGKQTNEFLLMKQGVIDFALGSTINWSTTVKELNLFSLPFFFPDVKALDAVEYGEVGKKLFAIMEGKGVVGLAWGENGYRELTNSKRAVKQPADLDGLKIRVVGSPIFIDTFKAMGANPVSMNWGEALSAFQQGTVDGQENPVNSVIIPNKLFQVHKYLTVWHCVIDPLVFTASKETWDSFDAKDKELIRKAAQEVAVWQKKAARRGLEDGTSTSLEAMKKDGMEVTVLTRKQAAAFKTRVKPVYETWTKEIGADLVTMAESEMAKSMKTPAPALAPAGKGK